jgi:hypothetical protein
MNFFKKKCAVFEINGNAYIFNKKKREISISSSGPAVAYYVNSNKLYPLPGKIQKKVGISDCFVQILASFSRFVGF